MKIQEEFDKIFAKEGSFNVQSSTDGVIAVRLSAQSAQFVATPDNTVSINGGCCAGSALKCVLLNSGLNSIGTRAFVGCKELCAIWIPASVESIEKDAFYGCEKLEIFCEGEPTAGWVNEKRYVQKIVRDAHSFYSGGGDEYTMVTLPETEKYNPLDRPVHTHVSMEEFLAKHASAC